MKLFRYRAPSLKALTGITHAKKAINKAAGITEAMKPVRALESLKRTVKRRTGYYSEPMKVLRNGLPRAMGVRSAASGFVGLMIMGAVVLAVILTAGFFSLIYKGK